MKDKAVIATRGSRLALIQSNIVAEKLNRLGVRTELLIIKTKGDIDQTSPLQVIGGDGLFVRAIEQTLINGLADIAVHSAKDLPYELADGLMIGCTPDEADPRDVLITKAPEWRKLASQAGSAGRKPVIGTDSPRRQSELLRLYPDAVTAPLRGNVPTRIRKLREGRYDGIVLAKAGLDRLNIDPENPEADITGLHMHIFGIGEMIPAPCQGILAVECRDPKVFAYQSHNENPDSGGRLPDKSNDEVLLHLLSQINDETAFRRFEAERYLFEFLKADCSAAIGVHAKQENSIITVRGLFGQNRAIESGNLREYKDVCDKVRRSIYK